MGFITESLEHLGSGCFLLFMQRHIRPLKFAKELEVFLGVRCSVNIRCYPAIICFRAGWDGGHLLAYNAQFLKAVCGSKL